jgi:hypothetical protein
MTHNKNLCIICNEEIHDRTCPKTASFCKRCFNIYYRIYGRIYQKGKLLERRRWEDKMGIRYKDLFKVRK